MRRQAQNFANTLRVRTQNWDENSLRLFVREYVSENSDFEGNELDELCELVITELRGTDPNCTSPFRFVEIATQVVPALDSVREARNNQPLKGGYSGEIEVEWAFEMPLLIGVPQGSGAQEIVVPMQLGSADDAPYVIPGATLRGMTRAAMEIVSRARLTQVNKHHTYGVRDFSHPLFTDDERLSWDELKAGWLCLAKDDDPPAGLGDSDYVITPCDKYLINIRALPAAFNGNTDTDYGTWHRIWLATPLLDRYKLAEMLKEGGDVDFRKTAKFHCEDGDYLVPDAAGNETGVYVFSGHSPTAPKANASVDDLTKFERTLDEQEANPDTGQHKKREYVFVERSGATPQRLKQDVFDKFVLISSKPSKNKPKPDGSYKVLASTLENGNRIPVFYIEDAAGNIKEIGLTRLFKRGHRYSVGDKIRQNLPQHWPDANNPDIVEALYGYVFEPDEKSQLGQTQADRSAPKEVARKGRVAFGFARLQNQSAAHVDPQAVTAVMTAPRASFGPFYLRGEKKDWSDADAKLAGRKRYFPRFPARSETLANAATKIECELRATATPQQGEDMKSRLKFLKPRVAGQELIFKGKIRLHNVLKEEIGALLWTLTHGGDPEKPYRHMFGRAKNFGAGQARVKSLSLRLRGHDATSNKVLAAAPESWEQPVNGGVAREGWLAPGSQSMTPFMAAFHVYMAEACSGWPKLPDLREFFGVSKPEEGAKLVDNGRVRHPLLNNKEFKNLRKKYGHEANEGVADRCLPAPRVVSIKTPYKS